MFIITGKEQQQRATYSSSSGGQQHPTAAAQAPTPPATPEEAHHCCCGRLRLLNLLRPQDDALERSRKRLAPGFLRQLGGGVRRFKVRSLGWDFSTAQLALHSMHHQKSRRDFLWCTCTPQQCCPHSPAAEPPWTGWVAKAPRPLRHTTSLPRAARAGREGRTRRRRHERLVPSARPQL